MYQNVTSKRRTWQDAADDEVKHTDVTITQDEHW